MKTKVVIYDCDNTIWDHYDVSTLKRPFRRVGDCVLDAKNSVVRLNVGISDALTYLKQRNIKLAIASFNVPEAAIDILRLFNLLDLIDYLVIEYHPYKDRMIKKIIAMASEDLEEKVYYSEVIFVDDNLWTVEYVSSRMPSLRVLRYGYDIKNHLEILNYI